MTRRPDLDDLDREIRDHIDAETAALVAQGVSEAEARVLAIRKFGNVALVKEDVRAVWVPRWADAIRQDAGDAIRRVRRDPALSIAIVMTLTLGIGLTTAIYSVVKAVLMEPLAYRHPERMVWLATRGKDSTHEIMNSIDLAKWQSQSTSFEHIVAYGPSDATLVAGADATRVRIVSVSSGFWQVTGAQPGLGALPTDADPQALVITHRTFLDQFNQDDGVIGKAVTIDGRAATVAAVLPEGFKPQMETFSFGLVFEGAEPAAYRMMRIDPPPTSISPTTAVRIYQVIAELKADVTIEQARAEIETIHARPQPDFPSPFDSSIVVMLPLRDKIVGPSAVALSVLLSASFIVLLIACANVANLLLSRGAERRKEIALRMSIGGGPVRVIRQLLAESIGYAILGGAGGVLLAWWLVNAVIALIGPSVPRLPETTIDLGVLAVVAAISMATAVLFGAAPALMLVFTNVQEVLKDGGRSVSTSRRMLRAGRLMIGAQVALAIVLLVGAGLMLKSVWQMTSYPPGFEPGHILTMRIDFRGPQYREPRTRQEAARALLEKARTMPGVRAAAVTTARNSSMVVLRENEPVPPPGERAAKSAPVSSISEDFGPLLGMSLISGRWLGADESQPAVVVNESLARRDFGNRSPLGSRIRLPWKGMDGFGTIIGVARDLKYAAIDSDAAPELFLHYTDTPIGGVTLLMKIDGDPMAAAPAIRSALSSIDSSQSIFMVRTMEAALAQSIAPRRFNLLLLGAFAAVALILAVLGVYGVVAYAVAERRLEIGIRLALGAERARVVRMVVAQGMSSVAAGTVVGVAGAYAATQWIAGLLYGVSATDPATFTATAVLLGAIALMACTLPALRAAWIDPATALRAE